MAEKTVCPICGEPTFVYMGNARKDKLCRKHGQELKAGTIVLCSECGEYHSIGKCPNKSSQKVVINHTSASALKPDPKTSVNKCIVCGEDAPNGDLCKECYSLMCDYKTFFDRNQTASELKEYYFNLVDSIYRMRSEHYIFSNCNKLKALASLYGSLYDDSLSIRVNNDIRKIIDRKKSRIAVKSPELDAADQERDSKLDRNIVARDGHQVRSHPECVIDGILYSLRVVHSYEDYVDVSLDDRNMKCDWFIPVESDTKGIYIEYWGMNTREYLKNKEIKREIYRKNDIPLVEIERDEIRDERLLTSRLRREINRLALDYFGKEKFI